MSHTSPARPGEAPVPAYRFAPAPPPPDHDKGGRTSICYGCAFHKDLSVRCSRIPCHLPANLNKIAKLV